MQTRSIVTSARRLSDPTVNQLAEANAPVGIYRENKTQIIAFTCLFL